MAYIGTAPTIGNFQVCDAISVVNNQAAYTMQVGGVNVVPETANHMLVSLNGILQAPTSSFTVSGSTITFASNLVTGDVIDFIQILGNVLDLGVPSDNTVTTAKLSDSSVSLAKLTATGTKDATTFLRGDNSFQEVPAGGITEIDMWRLTTTDSGVQNEKTLSSNWERNDSAWFDKTGTGMSESSGIFTFPSTGKWHIFFGAMVTGGGTNYAGVKTQVSTNSGGAYSTDTEAYAHTSGSSDYEQPKIESIIDVANVSTYRVRFRIMSLSPINFMGSTGANYTWVTFIRLGDT